MSGINIKPKTEESKAEETPAETSATYTSHPVENFRLGRYRFNKGLLTLTGDEVEAFDKLLESLPPADKRRVRKLDVAAAEEFVRQRLAEMMPAATQAFDSSIGERSKPVIGTGKLEDSNEQTDA
jgi:hypothetical protein